MARTKGSRNKRNVHPVELAVLTAIRQGNTLANAAMQAGITYSTLKRWRKLSAPFNAAVEKAEAEAEGLFVNDIAHAARDGSWQAAAWWLERRRTGDWRKPADRLELTEVRRAAEQTAAEIGKPELVDQIERDMLISIEAHR
jgi:hypothetical protein